MLENESDNSPLLESLVSLDDPGDDVQRRFRYQNTYAAILSVTMVEPDSNITDIFCEFHDDIIVKTINGKYRAIQVKTRDINFPPFCIEDEEIFKACKKFVLLEIKCPDQFEQFSIVSNAGYDKSRPAVCINRLLELLKKGESTTVLKSRTKTLAFVSKLAAECECQMQIVLVALKKMKVVTYCSLDDIHMKLENQLRICSILSKVSESKIQEIADLLLAQHFKLSSLHVEGDGIINLIVLGVITEDQQIEALVTSKRITKDQLVNELKGYQNEPVKLKLKDRQSIIGGLADHGRLTVKMDEGSINSESIGLMKDFKFAFEQHAASWIYKYGSEKAENQYTQLKKVTQNICQEAYEELNISTSNEGQKMLVKVRNDIKERMKVESDIFFDCSYEHILGAVGVLTEDCKVWWSDKFEIPR